MDWLTVFLTKPKPLGYTGDMDTIRNLLAQLQSGLSGMFNSGMFNSRMFNRKQAQQVEPQKETIAQLITPSTIPAPQRWRHPIYNNLLRSENGLKLDELLSGTSLASQETGVPQSLLMDIPAIESSGGQILKQNGGGPGRGPYQFEMPLPTDVAGVAGENFDPMSATQSALLAAKLIKDKQLGRWGKMGGKWGSVDNQRKDPSNRLTNYYSQEELAPYLR